MKDLNLINHIQTAVAVIDREMNIVDANAKFDERNPRQTISTGHKCYSAAYKFNECCTSKSGKDCPVATSFKTRESSRAIHHFWIDNDAVVEEVTATPVLDETGEVQYVVEEFRDITRLLGLNKGIIGICSYCRKIRNQDGEWVNFESYIEKNTGANFSHGICESCNSELYKKLKK